LIRKRISDVLTCRSFRLWSTLLLGIHALAASAATFTVTTPATSGPGSLQEAAFRSNTTPGRDTILFTSDGGVDTSVFFLDPVDIDGWTGTRRARVTHFFAMRAVTVVNFLPGGSGSTMRNLHVFPLQFNEALWIASGTTNVTLTGNLLEGVVRIEGDRNRIGGTDPADANDFRSTLRISFGDGNEVVGNLPMHVSVADRADDTRIFGSRLLSVNAREARGTVIEGNTISGGGIRMTQIFVADPGSTIAGNVIEGSSHGIIISSQNAVIRDNVIRNNGVGVLVSEPTQTEPIPFTGVSIIHNQIYGNGVAIDLAPFIGPPDGPTANDAAGDFDRGGNGLQNHPLLLSAISTPSSLLVTGTLTSAPLTPYEIELFANDAADPEARTPLGSFTATTDAIGKALFTHVVRSPLPLPGEVITSTATNRGANIDFGNGRNQTSEVSAPMGLSGAVIPGFDVTAYSVDETAGIVVILIRGGGHGGTYAVDYTTVDGSASAPGDYDAASGTLLFGAGTTEVALQIPIVADEEGEPPESFGVVLSNPRHGATISVASALITIQGSAAPATAIPTASVWALLAIIAGLCVVAAIRVH
jgi:hypothetical protein